MHTQCTSAAAEADEDKFATKVFVKRGMKMGDIARFRKEVKNLKTVQGH